jgi:prepilin-type N-terminal cleavage/methylation domain-containing protein
MSHNGPRTGDGNNGRRTSNGFTLIELLVVVAILAVVAAIALPALLRSRVAANESSAIASLRSIHTAQGAFSSICGRGGFAQSLNDLALPPVGSSQGFITATLASNGIFKSGYVANAMPDLGAIAVTPAAATCNNAAAPAVSLHFAELHPISIGITGERSFAISTEGAISLRIDGVTIAPGMAGAVVLQ